MLKLSSDNLHNKFLQKGGANNGILFIVAIMATLISFAFVLMGGVLPVAPEASVDAPKNTGQQEIEFEQNSDPGKKNLQLQTFTVKNTCEDKLAVDFLIDVSGSMAFGNKQANEKNALNSFVDRMSDTSVIGIQIFSDPNNVREIIPLSLFKDVKDEVRATINNLPASGYTSTRFAFNLAKQKLTEAISQNKYPGYNYSLIFLSDGIPETFMPESEKTDANCLARSPHPKDPRIQRCFARAQDPRTPVNIPEEIKLQGVDIYSIAITDPKDQPMKTELLQLLQDVSSDPDSTYFYESIDGNDLTTILDYVLKSICAAQ